MSKTVYKTHRVECDRCGKTQFLQTTSVKSGVREDPKVKFPEDDEFGKNVHCDCGNCLSPKASRFGPDGYNVLEYAVKRTTADELEDEDPKFNTLFD